MKQERQAPATGGDDGESEHSGSVRIRESQMLRKRAVEEETKWRTAHGFDTKLRGKHQVEAKRKRQPLERGEVRRRKERKRQRVARQMLARPLLKGVMVMTRENE